MTNNFDGKLQVLTDTSDMIKNCLVHEPLFLIIHSQSIQVGWFSRPLIMPFFFISKCVFCHGLLTMYMYLLDKVGERHLLWIFVTLRSFLNCNCLVLWLGMNHLSCLALVILMCRMNIYLNNICQNTLFNDWLILSIQVTANLYYCHHHHGMSYSLHYWVVIESKWKQVQSPWQCSA